MSNVTLIKAFFSEGSREVTRAELTALTKEEREDLATQINALG